MSLETVLCLSDGREIAARTINTSRAGLEIECDRGIRDLVFPQGQPVAPARRPTLIVRLLLPDPAAGGIWIEARGEAVIFRRVGENRYRLGIRFLAFAADGFARLERFIYTQGREAQGLHDA